MQLETINDIGNGCPAGYRLRLDNSRIELFVSTLNDEWCLKIHSKDTWAAQYFKDDDLGKFVELVKQFSDDFLQGPTSCTVEEADAVLTS